jgi:hypothetical protein
MTKTIKTVNLIRKILTVVHPTLGYFNKYGLHFLGETLIANFFNRVFSLDETKDEGKSGNGDRRIFE